MSKETYATYEEAAEDYLTKFRALRDVPPAPPEVITRGPGDIPAENLIEYADEIAKVSASMVPLAREVLDSPAPTLREGMGAHLLSQAAAELQLATELLQISEDEPKSVAPVAVRAARGAVLRNAIDVLERSMQTPVSQGLAVRVPVTRAARAEPGTPKEAREALAAAVGISTGAITLHVGEFGGDIALDLISPANWAAVKRGTLLLHKDVTEKLEALKEGVGALFARAVTVAAKTLLNVYDKILALLGKDVEDQARQKVKEWLEKMQEKGEIDLFEPLLKQLYKTKAFEEELQVWLAETGADVKTISATVGEVDLVSQRFIVLVGRLKTLEAAIVLARALLQFPQVPVIVAGLQVALLAVLIYAGFDYIGYKQPNLLNLTKGVAEVIQENLIVQA